MTTQDRRARTVLTVALLAMLALAAMATTPAGGDPDDSPQTGPWAEDGSVFLDWVRLSADDPDADPDDWYRVNLTAGPTDVDVLRITVNLTKDGAESLLVWASIHEPDGGILQEVRSTSYAQRSALVMCHRTGVYLVHVYTYSKFECHYRLEFEITQTANVTDGDDTLATATYLEPPADVTGHVHGIWDTFDHYAVNVTRDPQFYEFVEVRLAPTPNGSSVGRHDLDLFLIVVEDGSPREVSASTSNGSREAAFFAATVESQVVFIRVHAYGGDLDYDLNVTAYRVPDDGNNNILRAEELAPGQARADGLNITDRLDYFKVNLTGGDIVWVNTTTHDYDPVARKPNINLYLYDPTGRIINWSHSYDPLERMGHVVPMDYPPVWYYVLVTFHDRSPGDGIPPWGCYTINITIDHAPRILSDLPLEIEEDMSEKYLLITFLEDPEGMLRWFNVTVHEMDNVSASVYFSILEGGPWIRISPTPNFTGMAEFSLKATDAHRTVVLRVPVNVTPVPDAPALADPMPPLEVDEDTSATFDLTTVIVDGDGDALTFELVPLAGGALARSSLAGDLLKVVPAPDFFGEDPLLINASDGAGHNATFYLWFEVRPDQDAPRVVWAEPNVTVLEDARNAEFDLGLVFLEVDLEDLAFSVEETPGIPERPHVSFILLGDLLVFDPREDDNGMTSLLLRATDPHGAASEAVLTIHITPVNDPPRITSREPDGDVNLTEGDTEVFVITVTDPEGVALSYSWFLDGNVVDGEDLARFELVTYYSSQGTHLVTVEVTDGARTSWANWSVRVENVNRPPTLVLEKPKRGATYEEGTNIVFEAEVDDPDGEVLSVQWVLGGEVIGTGAVYTTSGLRPGKHDLTARVIDPHGSAAEATVRFEVSEKSGIPAAFGPIAAVAVLLTAMLAAAWHRTRRR